MPTTEIAIFPLKAGSKPGDPSDLSAQVLNDSFNTLKQQDGMQQVHFGTQYESPDVLQMMINWDSKQKHEDFIAATAYGPFMKHIGQIVGGDPVLTHVDFKSAGSLAKALSAPITEIATFYFDGAPASDYGSSVDKFAEKFVGKDGCLSLAYGTTYEDMEKDGVKGKAAVVVIGWQSHDAHMAFRAKPDFGENVKMLRGDSKAVEMHHVVMMQAQ